MRSLRWSSLPLRTKGVLIVALSVLPLACLWAIVGVMMLRDPSPANTVSRSLHVQAGLERLFGALVDADGGIRDYLLTENARAQDRYHAAVARLQPTLADLDRLIIDSNLRESLGTARSMVEEETHLLAALAGEDVEDGAPTNERVSLDRSVATLDRLRNVIATIEQGQMSLANERTAQAQRAARQWMAGLAVWSLVCVAGGVLASLWLARDISRRRAALAANVGRLAHGEEPLPLPRGGEETVELDAQFREAAALLRRREDDLRQTVARLETANGELEAFSYSVSHDLRAPLRAINGFGQALEEDWGDRLDEVGRDSLRRIRDGALQMGLLIDDMLNLSQISRATLRRETVDVSVTAATIAKELAEHQPDRPIDLVIAPNLVATADARMIRIALENLLGNAWKYTSRCARPRVEIGMSAVSGAPVFHVRDNGAGFDMQYADKLFWPFQRFHSDREFKGTGIGLATVRRIIDRHGGRIWAEAAVGAGATFYFTLEPMRSGLRHETGP